MSGPAIAVPTAGGAFVEHVTPPAVTRCPHQNNLRAACTSRLSDGAEQAAAYIAKFVLSAKRFEWLTASNISQRNQAIAQSTRVIEELREVLQAFAG